ncbi:MAG TPA: hypothetical protein VFW84_14725 [Aquabacterium sp.]|uniref:hypothetical protein n=1 Tax=Aquabacterium sp. TaxID=1872578 RepID=UPI002DB0182F|nr:hypothetical protein [Aquabacterium sp.]HET6786789.1 hypothetical protein [Aquabacterium sp.]HEX5373978.1 hypothetical protein [Aquabacterium sp.]
MAERPPKSPAWEAQFIGPPGRLRLAGVNAEQWQQLQDLQLPEGLRSGRAGPALRRGRDPSRTRLRLPAGTPPGDYEVLARWADGRQQAVTVSVQARPRLRVTPSVLRLVGLPDASVSARLLLNNRGNVPIDISSALVTGLFDDDGIETALASVYRMESTDVSQIVGHAFGKLREAHGGLLKLRVRDGAGLLAPGEQRLIDLETRLADKLQPGHSYHGVLEIGSHGIAIEVLVTKPLTGVTT